MPVLSVSIAEEEVGGIGIDNIVGQPVAWNYYQTIDTPGEPEVRRGLQGRLRGGPRHLRPDGGRLHLALPVEGHGREGRTRSRWRTSRRPPAASATTAPEGTVTVNGDNHHIAKTALIGKIGADGLIYTEWSSGAPIEPDPYLKTYPWASSLSS